jgi:sugar phosphate isomerase/epimerase
MKIALCNEVLRDMAFAAQCDYAAALGYDGLELAPFTLGPEPHLLGAAERARLRRDAAAAGIEIVGLHWLLVTPGGLSVNSPDDAARERTVAVLRDLIDLCADLGGTYLVHGSPAQRSVAKGDTFEAAQRRAVETFAAVAPEAETAGITYCIEPLARRETNFINTVEEAAALVELIGSSAFKTMIDTSAAGQTETLSMPDLIDAWLPTGLIGHIQVNDTNRRGPGQGDDRFAAVFAALLRNGYDRTVAVEPFDYHPDGKGAAARAAGYIRGILEALAQ